MKKRKKKKIEDLVRFFFFVSSEPWTDLTLLLESPATVVGVEFGSHGTTLPYVTVRYVINTESNRRNKE